MVLLVFPSVTRGFFEAGEGVARVLSGDLEGVRSYHIAVNILFNLFIFDESNALRIQTLVIASSTFSYLCICLSLLALLAVVVEFEAGDYTVLEDDGFVEVVLLKIGSSDIPVSVLLTTSTSSSASGTQSKVNTAEYALLKMGSCSSTTLCQYWDDRFTEHCTDYFTDTSHIVVLE